ncbi:MAG TPA: phage holin family protein [Verrucomicrobiae bacterium]|nr:phage holin family protein [Verrucomicrobiae bacterium]
MATASSGSAPPASGIVDTIRSFLASWIAVIKTRVEIISVELEEQREWLEELILLALGALFCLSLGLILLTLFVVVLFWENHPLAVLGGFTILYLGGGIALWIMLRQKIKSKPRIFSATAAELGKDYSALQPRTP